MTEYGELGGPRATETYCRDETDLIEQVRGSDFVATSTFPLNLVEKWMLYLVQFQTLFWDCMGIVLE